jgi:hypothetical protein
MPTLVISRPSSSEFDTPTDGVDDARTAREVALAVMSFLEHQNRHKKSRRKVKLRHGVHVIA